MELFGEAETIDENEMRAREELRQLVRDGRAIEILDTYYTCRQSCEYVYGTLHHIAHEVDSGISDEIVNFARNLLDDWSK